MSGGVVEQGMNILHQIITYIYTYNYIITSECRHCGASLSKLQKFANQ